MKNFRTYDLAVRQYNEVKKLKLPYYIKNQILRASFSVCLNLSEGNECSTVKNKRRFFTIALTSHREVQSIIKIERITKLDLLSNQLGAYLYRLCHSKLVLSARYKTPK